MQELEWDCACALSRRVARSVTQLYNLVLFPAGIKVTQFIALRALDNSGEIAQWRFAECCGLSPETLSRRLANLHKTGWVRVQRVAGSNEKLYSLTAEGKAKLIEATPHWVRAQRRLVQALGEKNWTSAMQVLSQLEDSAHAAEIARAANATQ